MRFPFALVAASAAALILAPIASAQNQMIRPFKTGAVTRAVVENTLNVRPQIQPQRGPKRLVDTNEEPTPLIPRGKANSLRAGSLTTVPTVNANKAGNWPGISATGWVPPDCTAAVSNNFVVVTVNVSIAFFSKDGTKLFEQGLGKGGFFDKVVTSTFVFDPKCFYDPYSGHFFVIAPETDSAAKTSGMLIAVSEGADPRGNWKKYRVDTKLTVGSNDFWLDYPGFGFNKDRIVFSGNMFGFTDGWGGVQVVSLNKANLIAGNTGDTVYYRAPNASSMQWCKTFDATSPVIYGGCFSSGSSMSLFALNGTNSGQAPLVQAEVTVPQFQGPSASRSVGGRLLDSLDGRMMTMAYRNGRVVGSHTIQPVGVAHAAARWYEVSTNNWPISSSAPVLRQAGNVEGALSEDCFMPAIGINKKNDISIIYSKSSSNITSDIFVSGHRANDALGTMGKPLKLLSSSGTYGSAGGVNRWGDYFSIELDPKDDYTFWGIAMSNDKGNWLTHVNSWALSQAIADGTPVHASAAGVYSQQGIISGGSKQDVWAAEGSTLQERTVNVANLGSVAALELSYPITNINRADITGLGVRVKMRTSTSTTMMLWLYNVKTKKYDIIKTLPATTAFAANLFEIQTATPTDYIAPDGTVKAVIRSLLPVRQQAPFTMYVDEATLLVAQ